MEEEKSEKMDVSYGVENNKSSSKPKSKKSKKKQAKAQKTEEKPKKKLTLLDQIEEMKASGDVNTPEFRKKMAELEVVLGIDEISPFGTNELDVFESKMASMTYSDMRDMAYKVGINPFLPHQRMKSALIQHFKDTNKNNMRNVMPGPSSSIKLDPNDPKDAAALKILGEI
jgi:hypothetical protein